MTFTDYLFLIDISLIALVLVQVKSRRLTVKALLLPIGIVAYVAFSFLKGIPTAQNDLVLVIGAVAIGGTLGGLAGKFTTVTRLAEGVFAKAGLAAAGLWILGTGGRLAFQVWATTVAARRSRTSAPRTASRAQPPGRLLILMALSEVVVRTGVLAWRSGLLSEGATRALGTAAPATMPSVSAPTVAVSPVRSRPLVPNGVGSMMDSGDAPLS